MRRLKPWKESASLNAQINLYGFWDATAFLTKSGDLGVVLRVGGVDYESLKLTDGRGLFLLVQPSAGKLWQYKYSFAGKEKRLALGPYPDVTLAMARGRHQQARRLVHSGIVGEVLFLKAVHIDGAIIFPEKNDRS